MQTLEPAPTKRANLYEQTAAHISRLIDQGTLLPGDRIPSVRQLSQQLKVSVTTVMEAYRVLEDRGMIVARPQSGYYVQAGRPPRLPEPESTRPAPDPTEVSVCDRVMMLMQDSGNPALVPLGGAIPDPDLLPTEKLNRILAGIARHKGHAAISYDRPPGCEELRIQVARRAVGMGCTLTRDEIVTTFGCQEAVNLCLRALCRPGDTVAVESPVFFGHLQAVESLGLRVLEIPTHPRDGMSLEALRLAIEQNDIRACIAISSFNNPLGSCMPDEKKREMVDLLAEYEIPLIEDDIYGDLCHGHERPIVAKSFDERGLVLLCSSFSKTLAPGYRVGWVSPGRYQKQVERLKTNSTIATATLPQMAIAEFLEGGGYDHYLRKVRRLYARQMALMAEAVARHFPPGTCVTRPAGGFVLWVEMPREVDSLTLYGEALNAGITFAPGVLFSAKMKYRNCLRLNAAYWSERVEEAIATLGTLAERPVAG